MKHLWMGILAILTCGSATAEQKPYQKYFSEFKKPEGAPPGLDYSKKWQVPRIELGQKLFFDPRISGSKWISCGTCHNPALGWEDGLSLGFGHGMKKLGRHTPTILNLAYSEAEAFFWDGRASSLEEQALGPIESAAEMNLNLDEMVASLKKIKGYQELFNKSFPGGKITKNNVAKAIADFERTIVSAEAPFDRWIKGQANAISPSAKRGFKLFNEKANCAVCHSGWRFTDDGFHNIGVGGDDQGRFAVLPIDVLKGAFKTPTLRNIALRAPYLHNGSEPSLESVVAFYNRGGNNFGPSKSAEVRPLGLSAPEQADLVAFLHTLTSKDKAISITSLPQ